jgi:hypothetical protein
MQNGAARRRWLQTQLWSVPTLYLTSAPLSTLISYFEEYLSLQGYLTYISMPWRRRGKRPEVIAAADEDHP